MTKRVLIPVRVEPQQREELASLARRVERSQAWLIRRAIDAYLRRHSKEPRHAGR